MKLGFYDVTALNIYEQRLHCTREHVALEVLSGISVKCNICGEPLSKPGRVWKEHDEAPDIFLDMIIGVR